MKQSGSPQERSIAAIERELQGEKAGALGRYGKAVEEALAALRHADDTQSPRATELVDEAARAVWYYFVTREACGLRSHERVIEFYGIPGRVLARVGAVRP
jgi:uncharacterized Ntn-hydrolase superfamily protein